MTLALTPQRERWLLLSLAGIQFTHILDFMIMMPLGPQFVQLLGISNAEFGWLVSAYTLSAGVSGLAAATYIDRFDRKRVLLWMYALFGVATLACGLAQGYGWLMLARVAAGVFGGVLSALSQTIVADVVPFERRGRAMGVVMTSFSVATVAGVPLGLFCAAYLSWHAPFFGIAALVALLWLGAYKTLPALNGHVGHLRGTSVWRAIGQVVVSRNHLKAFALSALMMFSGFTVIPYITIYLQANAGVPSAVVPWLYLLGGAATFFTAPLFGRWTDRVGKAVVFRRTALLLPLVLLSTTLSAGLALPVLLGISTLFFVLMSGRMIPGMALLSAAAAPQMRGTFMTLNAAVQSAAMGVAALVAGWVVGRDAQGLLTHYWVAGVLGSVASCLAAWLAGKVHLHQGPPAP